MIRTRQALIADLDPLTAMFDAYRQFYGQPSDIAGARAFLADRFEHQQSIIFLALEGEGRPLGFTQLYPSFTSARMRRIFILNDLYVVPESRGRGAGKALLAAAIAYGRQTGASGLRLSTAVDNVTAQAVYQSNGWTRDEAFHSYNFALD